MSMFTAWVLPVMNQESMLMASTLRLPRPTQLCKLCPLGCAWLMLPAASMSRILTPGTRVWVVISPRGYMTSPMSSNRCENARHRCCWQHEPCAAQSTKFAKLGWPRQGQGRCHEHRLLVHHGEHPCSEHRHR